MAAQNSTALPAVCYDDCNDAYTEAQEIGMKPALCATNSTYIEYYNACLSCLGNNNITQADLQYLEPSFSQFFNYCSSLQASSEGVLTLPATYFSIATKTAWVNTTLADGAVYSQPVTVTMTLPNLAAWNITTGTSSSTAPMTSSSPSETISNTPSPIPTPSSAWIASPVIGSIAGVTIVIVGITYWIRWHKRRSVREAYYPTIYEKAQLHGDSLPPQISPQEMEASLPVPKEMEASVLFPKEMAVYENHAHELAPQTYDTSHGS